MAVVNSKQTASFKTERINKSTFLVVEDDAFREHPFIYVKIHPKAPIIVLSDTGCDEPSAKSKNADFTHLRDYLENFPIKSNSKKPLNPGGHRQYYIICTHCHYDHIGGISQFLEGGRTEIIASAAGKDFIESDLEAHGLFKYIDKVAPYYQVTHWAQAWERLQCPIQHHNDDYTVQARKPIDLGMTFIHTPGHTQDELAWYDHDEMHVYVGDSLYEEGEDGMAIEFPAEGSFVEWAFAMHKVQYLVRGENARSAARAEKEDDDGWCQVAKRVKLAAGHQTHSADAEPFLEKVGQFWWDTLAGKVPVIKKQYKRGEAYYTWREKDGKSGLSFHAPARLMDEARKFFEGTGVFATGHLGSDFPG
ncbi:hypothetical protein M409DRAFT_53122 [Zasmidium cellare ATCC 36951]|uniref:Metallo-beta-lactamase domain-containing protein n=1 Tax=Zasmidium cellare ATCC 36951 TaxID=1080233 RepID=A0A6A6CP57_ZASCE|nr:uncharacterized protein M409DRAFT_53122 [Zasmidium cellare ATCC 36951]KAF2168443.1 hypothetical protein M409DRAFT_53122 [Zasmidium cellare ATCC 36951]